MSNTVPSNGTVLATTKTGSTAHIVVDGSTLCPRPIETTNVVNELPNGGMCDNCKRQGKFDRTLEPALKEIYE